MARLALAASICLGLPLGCAAAPATRSAAPSTKPSTAPTTEAAESQPSFGSPEDAVKALTAAAKASDRAAVHRLFGPVADEIVSDDKVQAAHSFQVLATALGEMTNLVKIDDQKDILYLGSKNWPFPIPIVRGADGKWFFDTAAGKEEILNRRIGRNELHTIRVIHAYVEAQRQYQLADHTGNDVAKYAQRLGSNPGKKDGLYWEAADTEEQSPLSPLVAEAKRQGYAQYDGVLGDVKDDTTPEPYHGYYFRILTKQGAHAAGGKYDYVINDNMIGGFALIAYPSSWGNNGVMTFIVNQQGKVYEKNLGEDTLKAAAAITEYDPDETWSVVKE